MRWSPGVPAEELGEDDEVGNAADERRREGVAQNVDGCALLRPGGDGDRSDDGWWAPLTVRWSLRDRAVLSLAPRQSPRSVSHPVSAVYSLGWIETRQARSPLP
jgi:hypothetical protein